MTPQEWFALTIITILLMMGLAQVPLLGDLITKSGYSPAEVWSGVTVTAVMLYTAIFALRH